MEATPGGSTAPFAPLGRAPEIALIKAFLRRAAEAGEALLIAGEPGAGKTLMLDAAKGAAAVWLASHFANQSAAWMIVAGLAALAGHCFPVWLRFHGGKGVATAAGIFLML